MITCKIFAKKYWFHIRSWIIENNKISEISCIFILLLKGGRLKISSNTVYMDRCVQGKFAQD